MSDDEPIAQIGTPPATATRRTARGGAAAKESYCVHMTRSSGDDLFEGFFGRNGERNGKGRYTWADGTVALCMWSDGCCHPFDEATKNRTEAEEAERQRKRERRQKQESQKERKLEKKQYCVKCGNSILNAMNATRRTVRNANKKVTITVLKAKDHRAIAWVGRAFQCWRGNSIGACASNAEILATNSILNALTARRRTARDVNKKLAMKGLKTDDHRASV